MTQVWSYLFTTSKFVELFDTVFIVLRKRKLLFLHYYHHITSFIISWHFYFNLVPMLRWTQVMNYFVHSFMYSYYATQSFRIKLPRFISISITSIQIIQMIIGLFMSIYAALITFNGYPCLTISKVYNILILTYTSYLILFVNFFVKTYTTQKTKFKKS